MSRLPTRGRFGSRSAARRRSGFHSPSPSEPPSGDLISHVHLSSTTLDAEALTPALLTLRLGRLVESASGSGRVEVIPVARFDVELVDPGGQPLGLLARVRDVLPGTYAFALTGRAPSGARLAPGKYVLRLRAFPTDGGPPDPPAGSGSPFGSADLYST